jgi:deoxyribonuclease-4
MTGKSKQAPAQVRLRPAPQTAPASPAGSKKRLTVSLHDEPRPPLKFPPGVLLGAHTSTAGGVGRAIERASACGFTAAQIFVKNNKQWFAPPLPEEEARAFRAARKRSGIFFFAHNSYLVNLASPDAPMFATSVKAMIGELERAEALGIPFMVMHPGSHGGAGEEAGLTRIVQGLDEITAVTPGYKCRLALEITAGQGNALGYRLEHLGSLLERVKSVRRFGVCLDTAHLYAAGYDVRTRSGYDATMARIKKIVGLRNVLALHLNDSKVPLGKRVDRHALLGEGEVGIDCFRWIVQDNSWRGVPMVLETPKSEDMHEDVDSLGKLAPYLR